MPDVTLLSYYGSVPPLHGPATVAVPPLHAGRPRRQCGPRRQCRAGQRSAAKRHVCICVHIYYIYMSRVHITCNLHSDALQFIYTWANTHNHKKAHTRYLYMGKYNHVRLSVRIHKHAPMHKRRTCMHINIYMCIYMHVCVCARVRYTYKHIHHGCVCTFATNPKS